MHVQIYDFRWTDETAAELQAVAGGRFGRKKVAPGASISMHVGGACHCAGVVVDGAWQPCASATPETRPKCQLCRSKEGSFVYTAFDGFNTDQVTPTDLEKISGPHVVYLALFDRDLIKVGVSGMGRKTMRQIEQGSHATLYIAETPDGVLARQIETLIRRNGLQDKVQASKKQDTLRPDISHEEACAILEGVLAEAKAALSAVPHLEKHLLQEPECALWEEKYGLPRGPLPAIELKVGDGISGTIRGMKGAFVAIETDAEQVVLNMKKLRGFEVDFTPTLPGLRLSSALQGALF